MRPAAFIRNIFSDEHDAHSIALGSPNCAVLQFPAHPGHCAVCLLHRCCDPAARTRAQHKPHPLFPEPLRQHPTRADGKDLVNIEGRWLYQPGSLSLLKL